MSGVENSTLLVVYLAFIAYLVLRLGRRPPESAIDYLLAGRSLTLPAFVGTLVASWYGGILGVGEYGYRFGISNWLVFGVPYYVAALAFAFFVATRARRSPFVSIPDALGRTYGPNAARLGGLLVFIMTAPASYVLMMGTLFAYVLGVPPWLGIVGGALLSLIYVARGGLRAVVATDLLQFILMFGSMIIVVVTLVGTYGVVPIRQDVPATHWTWHGGNSAQYIIVWFFIALATLIEPTFYQRVFAARTPAVARRGIFVSVGFWIFFDMLSTTTALYARALLPPGSDPILAYPALAANFLPAGVAALFFVGMSATIMSTVDTYGFIAATTLSNLVGRRQTEVDDHAARRTRLGLLATGVWAVGLALLSESVIELWHSLGSIGTPALLLPMLGTFYAPLRMGARGATMWIVLPATVAALWLWSGRGGAYWLGVEPIYAGLLTSVLVAITNLRVRVGH